MSNKKSLEERISNLEEAILALQSQVRRLAGGSFPSPNIQIIPQSPLGPIKTTDIPPEKPRIWCGGSGDDVTVSLGGQQGTTRNSVSVDSPVT